jgi:protein-disulfide isomerase
MEEEKINQNNIEKNEIEKNEQENKKINQQNISIPTAIILAGIIIASAILFSNFGMKILEKKSIDQKQNNYQYTNEQSLKQQNQEQNKEQNNVENNAQNNETEITNQDKNIINKEVHIRGNPNAKITLVEFSDFECPFCERHYHTLKQLLKKYKDKIKLVYKHFPLDIHTNARKAAEAAECAGEQGKFWEYHDKLFDNFYNKYSIEKFKKWASELNLDTKQFNKCLDSGKYSEKVQKDFEEGISKKVNGTPTTFINDQIVEGALPYEYLEAIIEEQLKK